jgi:hypothetical protein
MDTKLVAPSENIIDDCDATNNDFHGANIEPSENVVNRPLLPVCGIHELEMGALTEIEAVESYNRPLITGANGSEIPLPAGPLGP